MKTIEEVSEWLRKAQNKGEGWISLSDLRALIDSEPSCKHPFTWRAVPDLESRQRTHLYTYCPDCGNKLERNELGR